MEKRHPSISVARSRTPKAFIPSGETAYSSCTTPMWRNPSRSGPSRFRDAGQDDGFQLPVVWAPAPVLRVQPFGRHNQSTCEFPTYLSPPSWCSIGFVKVRKTQGLCCCVRMTGMCRAHSIHEKADTGGERRGLASGVCPSELVFQCPEFKNRCIRIAGDRFAST
jgi:hypothetical protein